MELLAIILRLASVPEFWAGVGATLFIGLAGLIVLLVFGDPAEPATPAQTPDWLKTHSELTRAAAARQARADAERWGRRERRDGPRSHGRPQ